MKNNYFDEAMTYGNLRRALNKCCRNVRWKDSVVGYELHASQNTHNLINQIQNDKYELSKYQIFTVYEPKVREIVATRIPDRQVQMALCDNGLYEDLTEHFIYDNCACQIGKGTDFALKRLKIHMLRHYRQYGRDGWILKCDIKKFFPSTKHDVAKAAARKRISDDNVYKMVADIIDSFDGDIGIGLGSQISQLIELAVLDDLDHFIKERLKIKGYIRYMDDFILIHHDKEYLKYCYDQIQKELAKIHLKLNEKTSLFPFKQGVKFLQWRFIVTSTGAVKLKMTDKKQSKERKRIRKLIQKEQNGEVSDGTAYNSLISWKAHADKGSIYHQVRRMIEFYYNVRRNIKYGDNSRNGAKSTTRCMAGEERSNDKRRKHRLYSDNGRHRNSY